MSDEDRNKALLRRFYEELWSQGDLEAISELVADDFVDHYPLLGAPPGRRNGRANHHVADRFSRHA